MGGLGVVKGGETGAKLFEGSGEGGVGSCELGAGGSDAIEILLRSGEVVLEGRGAIAEGGEVGIGGLETSFQRVKLVADLAKLALGLVFEVVGGLGVVLGLGNIQFDARKLRLSSGESLLVRMSTVLERILKVAGSSSTSGGLFEEQN